MRSGMPTFSAADKIGIRPKDWKMNDTLVRRICIRSESVMAVTSRPATSTVPLSARSRPPTMFSSVVLPEPDLPRSATSWPCGMVNETPRSACAADGPLPNVLVTSCAHTILVPSAGAVMAGSGRPPAVMPKYCSRA
jgi:hypothetical protein